MCPLIYMKASVYVYICTSDCKGYIAMIEANTKAEIYFYTQLFIWGFTWTICMGILLTSWTGY